MAFVNFVLAFIFESIVVDYIVFHKLKATKFYKKLDSNMPRYKEINQQTRNNTDWLKEAIDSTVGIVNKGFETTAAANVVLDVNNTNSNTSLISNNNSTVDLISRGYEEQDSANQQASFVDKKTKESSTLDNIKFAPVNKNSMNSSHINKNVIHVDVHNKNEI